MRIPVVMFQKLIVLSSLVLAPLSCASSSQASSEASANPRSREEIIAELAQKISSPEGVQLRIHGVNHEAKLYVGAYVYDNIFNEIQVSLLTRDSAVREAFTSLTRHDLVRVWGRVLNFDAPQPHLSISRIVVEKKYVFPGDEHKPDVDWESVARELQGKTEAVVMVHTIQMDGQLLVVEFKDQIFPIFNKEFPEQARSLNRQDVIRIHFAIQESPQKPIHLVLKANAQGVAIEQIDAISKQHGQSLNFEGALLLFPQSPIVKFNVFAIKVPLENDLHRTYTLISFDDPELFKAIREKLQAAWDSGDASCVKNDRNKLINPCIRVRAKGVINHVDPNQANPQILPLRIEDVEVLKAQ